MFLLNPDQMPPASGNVTRGRACPEQVGRRGAGQVEIGLSLRLGQRRRGRTRCRTRPTRLAGGGTAAAAAIDQEAVHRVRYGVEGGPHDRQATECLPLIGVVEADLEGDAPAVHVPGAVARAVGERRLDQIRDIRGLPLQGGELAVQNLYRPPFRHNLKYYLCSTSGGNGSRATAASCIAPDRRLRLVHFDTTLNAWIRSCVQTMPSLWRPRLKCVSYSSTRSDGSIRTNPLAE